MAIFTSDPDRPRARISVQPMIEGLFGQGCVRLAVRDEKTMTLDQRDSVAGCRLSRSARDIVRHIARGELDDAEALWHR